MVFNGGRLQRVGFCVILVLYLVFYWYGVCGFLWRKLPCMSDVETFQTFLDPNVVIVKKLFNTLLF